MPIRTDQELIEFFVNGDEDAFNELYGRYQQLVRNIIKRFVPRSFYSELDDICQHFWLNLIRYAKSFDKRYDKSKSARNWLITCAVNSIYNYRKSSTTLKFTNNVVQLDLDVFDPTGNETASEERAIVNEEYGIAINALDKIPPSFRKVIQGLIIKGLTPCEYAENENIVRQGVSKYCARAIERLREVREIKKLIGE